MLNEFIFLLLLAIGPAGFSLFLDYCFGKPMSDEPNVQAIFFRYTLFLSRLRLGPGRIYDMKNDLKPLLMSGDWEQRADGYRQLNLTILMEARKFFKWEQAFGMCVFCSNLWVSLIFATVYSLTIPLVHFNTFCFFLFIPITSHLILRKF